MKNLTNILAFGTMFLANTVSAEIAGISKEKAGDYRIFGDSKDYIVLTDGNKDGTLDRIDVYKDGMKKETLVRDFIENDLIKFDFDCSDKGYICFEGSEQEYEYYRQNYWIGRV